VLKDFQQELIRRLELAQRLQDSIKADSCLTDDDRIRLSNLEAAVIRIQRLADARLAKLHAALKLVWFPDGRFVNYCMPNIDEGPCQQSCSGNCQFSVSKQSPNKPRFYSNTDDDIIINSQPIKQ